MKEKKQMEDILERGYLKENPFGTPAGYFSKMQQEVMETISAMPHVQIEEESTPASKPTFLTYLKPALTLASVFGIVIGMGYGAMKLTDILAHKEAAPLAETTKASDTQEFADSDMASILNITIEDLFAENENNNGAVEVLAPEIDKETIEEYLIDTRLPASAIALLE